jgi:hypothetical protein
MPQVPARRNPNPWAGIEEAKRALRDGTRIYQGIAKMSARLPPRKRKLTRPRPKARRRGRTDDSQGIILDDRGQEQPRDRARAQRATKLRP